MNSFKILQKYGILTLRNFSKFIRPNTMVIIKAMKNPVIPLLSWGTLFSIQPEILPTKTGPKSPVDFSSQLKEDCTNSERKINNLILTLQSAIKEVCRDYRLCLQKQVKILENGFNIDPLDEYWDSLVPLRVEATNLKRDFESYRCMVEYIGQLAFNLAFCSALVSNLDTKDYVCNDYFELEKLAKEQLEENRKIEEILLQRNMQSILCTNNTTKDLKSVIQDIKSSIIRTKEEQERAVQKTLIVQ